MRPQPLDLQSLLISGQAWWGRSSQTRAPQWDTAELAGRYVELCGAGPAAVLTAAVVLVRDAQQRRETVAWVTAPPFAFYPPDVADHGVDLAALAVVWVQDLRAQLRAADQLLRSGGFGLAVLDLRPFAGEGDGTVSLAAQVRLAGLAQQHDAVLLCLQGPPRRGAAANSLASLRVQTVRAKVRTGRYRCTLRATKDKRRGRTWESERVFRGPLGLH